MTEKEIEKYSKWYFIEETTERLMDRIKEINDGAEIKGIDDFENLLDDSIKFLTQKIEELSDKNEANITYQMIYNTVLNKFLFVISLELLHINNSLKRDELPFSTYIHYEADNKYMLDQRMITYWLKGELALPYLFIGFTKSINSKWLDAWRKNVMKAGISDSINKEMLKPLAQNEDTKEETYFINEAKKYRAKTLDSGNKLTFTDFAKYIGQKRTTLIDRFKRLGIYDQIKKVVS